MKLTRIIEYSDKELNTAYERYVDNCQPMAGNFDYFKHKLMNNEEFANRWLPLKRSRNLNRR